MNQEKKLYSVNARLGNRVARSGQQTTRIVYDTEPTSLATTSLEFFVNFAGKDRDATNLKEGKLSSNESMVIKQINLVSSAPIIGMVTADVYIGSSRVIKDLPITFNAIAGLDWNPLNIPSVTRFSARLVTDLVIPPQVNFSVKCRVQAGSFSDASTLSLALSGFGIMFNPQSSL